MKRHFEWPVNPQVESRLKAYYDSPSLLQHDRSVQQHKTRLKLQRIRELAPFSRDDTVLDIGCASGILLAMLAPDIARGLGIDIAEPIIAEARKTITMPQLEFRTYDGRTIDTATAKTFSKIMLIDVLEHAVDPDALIRSVAPHLADRGQLIIKVPFTGWLSELATRRYHEGHLRYYDPTYLAAYLASFNFTVVRMAVHNSVPLSSMLLKRARPLWRVLDRLCRLIPSRIYPYFGEIIVVAEKA